MRNHQHINADSGNDEYYTPPEIIAAARRVLGSIDLDPAASVRSNKTVRARKIFTAQSDGLKHPWVGKVWMNHPFGKKTNGPWVNKLVNEFEAGNVSEAVCITFAATSERWFLPLLLRPQCFLTKRTNYLTANGTVKRGAPKGSVVTYFGKRCHVFREEFKKLGIIKMEVAA